LRTIRRRDSRSARRSGSTRPDGTSCAAEVPGTFSPIQTVMLDFEVQRCTRRCAKTDRDLQPGETIYSVLVAEGAEVVRYDYAADAWDGAPENALGWWRSKIPEPNANRMHWAPSDVMLQYFEELEGRQDKRDERYVLALLLLRRRIVRSEETEVDADGREVLILHCPKNEKEYRVAVLLPEPNRLREIQEALARLLFVGVTA
jgi:hypothetical protein